MASPGLHQAQWATFRYKFSEHGGAQAVHTLTGGASDCTVIPDNAQILRCRTESIEAIVGPGASIKLGVTGNDDCFEGATAITDNSYDTPGTADVKESELPLKVDNADGVSVIATSSGANITAGEFDVHVEYLPGR